MWYWGKPFVMLTSYSFALCLIFIKYDEDQSLSRYLNRMMLHEVLKALDSIAGTSSQGAS